MEPTLLTLEQKANSIRNTVLEMCIAGGGHLVSSFSCVDILVALYYGDLLRFDPRNPRWAERDRFVLSKGHAAPALYAILADVGFFPNEELARYAQKEACLDLIQINLSLVLKQRPVR